MKANRRKTGRIIMLLAVLAFLFMIPLSSMAADNEDFYRKQTEKFSITQKAMSKSTKNLKADENTVDLVLDFGAGHEAFVAKWYKAGASSTVAGKYRYS